MKRLFLIAAAAISLPLGCSDSSTISPPPAPENVNVQSQGSEITVAWEESEQATTYNIYHAHEPGLDPVNYAAFQGGSVIQNVSPPYSFDVVDREPVYHIVVTAQAGSAESPGSEEKIAILRYEVAGDEGELIHDVVNGLEWARCAYGQDWNATSQQCEGAGIRTNLTEHVSAASSMDMRVPTLSELRSLVFCSSNDPAYFPGNSGGSSQCSSSFDAPTIVSDYFPDTPYAGSYITQSSCGTDIHHVVNFESGYSGICAPGYHPDLYVHGRYVRLLD